MYSNVIVITEDELDELLNSSLEEIEKELLGVFVC